MALAVSVTEVARHFSEYVGRVANRGESFILVKGNKSVAELRPLPSGGRLGELPRLMESLPHLPANEAKEFAEDVNAARGEMAAVEVLDPWRS